MNIIDTNLDSIINDSTITLDVSNLISNNLCDLEHGCSLLFGIEVNLSHININDFKEKFFNIPNKLKINSIRKTNEISYGYTNYAGKQRKNICSIEYKSLLVGNKFGYDSNIPELLCSHKDADSVIFYNTYIKDLLSMMNNVLMTNFPQVYTRQNDKILNDFKINSTCFTKVTIRVTGIDDPACKMHVDRSNYGYCCILILNLENNQHFSGGHQIIQIGRNIFKMKCRHGDLFIGEYHNLIHGVLKVTHGRRCAIIAYTSNKIMSYCRLRKMMVSE